MDPPHFLGNFSSPMPIQKEAIGPAKQIAYYSCFQGPTNQYEYQSRSALKIYSPPTIPFSFFNVPNKLAWAQECNRLDSLPQQGIEPVITSCQRAGCVDDLLKADVITRRGVVVDLAMGKKEAYHVSFVEGRLHITRKSFDFRTDIRNTGPYYGDCFEKLCTRKMTKRLHGIFFGVVSRRIGDVEIIMAGEVDCSSSTDTVPDAKDYIELKTIKKASYASPSRSDQWFPRWYLQSHLFGTKTMAIGYRNFTNRVFRVDLKPVEEVLQDAQKYVPSFNPAVDMGRVHSILSTLLAHFHSPGQFVSTQDKFELRVEANGDVWLASQ